MRAERVWLLVSVVVAGLVLASCGASAAEPDLRVVDAFTIPGDRSIAVYLQIDNAGGADRIVDVAVTDDDGDLARSVSLHRTVERDGLAVMEPVDGLTVAADSRTALMPGRGHVMIEGLQRPIAPGDRLTLTVHFDRSPTTEVTVRVITVDEAMAALDSEEDLP